MSAFEKVEGAFDYEVGISDWGTKGWFVVRLPHQCDEWVIAESPDRDTAIAELEAFIGEAQGALEKLRQLETAPAEERNLE